MGQNNDTTAVNPGQLLAAVELSIDEDKLSNALLKRVESLRQIKALQNASTNSSDSYMVGLFNGLSLALATMENKEPVFMATQNNENQLAHSILSLFSNAEIVDHLELRKQMQVDEIIKSNEVYLKQNNGPMQKNKTEYFG